MTVPYPNPWEEPPGEAPLPPELESLLGRALAEELAPVPPPDERRMLANRSAFLTAGIELAAPAPRPEARPFWMALGRQLGLAWVLVLCLLVGGRLLAARALPGDTLYPVKLGMAQADRLFMDAPTWEAAQEARLQQEAIQQAMQGRAATVEFEGILEQKPGGVWEIAGLLVPLDREQEALARQLCPGWPVRVRGSLVNGAVQLELLTPTCMEVASAHHLP